MTATPPSVTGLYVGTSGFSYPTWRPGFYPAGTRPDDFLGFYSRKLPSVELNTTFYDLPSEAQFQRWAGQTPPGFRFAVKMHRRITYFGRLDLFGTFCESAAALRDKLGPILVQFPEGRKRDDGVLRFLLDSLDPKFAYAFEFRDESWAVDDVLADAGVARVGALDGGAPFRYLRMREPPYRRAALEALAADVASLLGSEIDVYCYFKHEDAPTGPRYAARLLRVVEALQAGSTRSEGVPSGGKNLSEST